MNKTAMLLEFGAANYFSFKEWFKISFELNKNCPEDISEGDSVSKIIGIKGANASGKTNVLKCLTFIHSFCYRSFQKEPEAPLDIQSYFGSDKPCEFFIEFISNSVQYRYELTATNKIVINETLYRKNKRYTKIIERTNNTISEVVKEFSNIELIKLRSNCSFISSARQYEIEELNDVIKFFENSISNISSLSGFIDADVDLSTISKFYKHNDDYFKFAKELIIKSDAGINDIVISNFENSKGEEVFYPLFLFETEGGIKYLAHHTQSSGTKVLFHQLWMYHFALSKGGLLILDEFDIKLHPFIAPYLLELFSKKNNKSNAQIIFTTHNTEILDYLGKYRTYFINKDFNESYAYRLDEISGDILRNDRLITPVYKQGKIGGVPRL